MQCAASFAPLLVRKPLHVDVEREWMLMEDYGPTLDGKFSRVDFESILILHGKLQLESVHHVQELMNAGVPQQGADSIMRRAQRMLEDPGIRESLIKFEDFAPRDDSGKHDLTQYCQAVSLFLKHIYEAQRLPLALVHGDLYDDNIIKQDGNTNKYVVYDWGSARIDLPFSDVAHLITEVTPREEQREDSIDSYLQLWVEYGSLPELREICCCVSTKDVLVRLLDRFEYAKEERLHPSLEDTDMKYLQDILTAMHKKVSELKG